jgi:broad specificity phosphatase PhoE
MKTLVHLVRHAEVHNPKNIWYGRLDGFPLSERGLRQAAQLGEWFKGKAVEAVYTSPLERALQTAAEIAGHHDLEVVSEPDIIESITRLEGKPGDLRLFLNPLRIFYFINPFRPSWGERFSVTRERMVRAVEKMRVNHSGGEAVAVSHMTPIQVARLAMENDSTPAWRQTVPAGRASVTTLIFDGDEFVEATYTPVGSDVE